MPIAAPTFRRAPARCVPALAPGGAPAPTSLVADVPVFEPGHYDARRGSSAARGYGHRWRVARAGHLQAHPLCVHCLAADPPRTAAATVVDHITPHKGDMELFWDTANWQGLCKPCHDRKTVLEDGGLRPGVVNWHPEWLQPSAADLTIVCGLPGSGKTTWVARQAVSGDVVIDMDAIGGEMAGTAPHAWPRSLLVRVGRERNRRLMALSGPEMAGRRAWFIVSEPRPERRDWWQRVLQPSRIVVMETPPHECVRRINADPSRPRTTGRRIEALWRQYRRRHDDVVVTAGSGLV